VYGCFRHDVGVESVAEVDRVDVVTIRIEELSLNCIDSIRAGAPEHISSLGYTHHSKSLYMIVKKTWRKRLTAFMSTASRYSHASPDILL